MFLKFFDKKALTQNFLVLLIVSIVTLLVILLIFSSIIGKWKYETSLENCNFFFKEVGKNSKVYFGEYLNNPSKIFFNSMALSCPTKFEKVSTKEEVSKLISNCYFQTGNGVNILGKNYVGNLCFVCS